MIELDGKDPEMMVVEMLEAAVINSFIEQLAEGTIALDDEILTSFCAVVFKTDKQIDFIKAVGLRKFDGNREACLAINDFCAVLKDMRATGKEELHK